MTNGEKIQQIFPNGNYEHVRKLSGMNRYEITSSELYYPLCFSEEWWNTEYKEPTTINDSPKYCDRNICLRNEYNNVGCEDCEVTRSQEPTTKNDLVTIHTEGLDEGIRCAMCTNSMKSDRGCDGGCVVNKDMYKAVMDAIEKHIQPTTKNDLGVDCISRADAIRVASGYCHPSNVAKELANLPSVTPQEPKTGHWLMPDKEYSSKIWRKCSCCGTHIEKYFKHISVDGEVHYTPYVINYCYVCGAKMVEPQESEVENGNDD